MPRVLRLATIFATLALFACSGSGGCSSCGTGLQPIPGGFDRAAAIEKAAQVRVTNAGLGFVETQFQSVVSSYAKLSCGGPEDVPCPTGFVTIPGGAANPSSCNVTEQVCVESASGDSGPFFGVEIANTVSGDAILCRDDPTDPNRRRCFVYARLETLDLQPRAPDTLGASLELQLYTTPIPIRYEVLGIGGLDCLVEVDSGADGSPLQAIQVELELVPWSAPSGAVGGQLDVNVLSADTTLADADLIVSPDPVAGGLDDQLICRVGNIGFVKDLLVGIFLDDIEAMLQEQVDKALGWKCPGTGTELCPNGTSCNPDGVCQVDGSEEIVPAKLGVEGRLDLGQLLALFAAGRPGASDIMFLMGGNQGASSAGLSLAALGGAEVVTPDPACAAASPSPRLRSGFTPPPALPASEQADLDFDGTPETSYMVAIGVSDALLDQYVWSMHQAGVFCARLSGFEIPFLNTGSLSLLVRSLEELTHKDRYSWADYPAMLVLRPGVEPVIDIGSGRVGGTPEAPVLEEPLIRLTFDDLRFDFFAVVEDRWVRLMRVELDLVLGFGVMITPNNELQLVMGDLRQAVDPASVRVSESEILREDPRALEMAIPALISFLVPNLAGVMPLIPLPAASELGGFELEVLGARGLDDGMGRYPNMAVYANLGFDPAAAPNLVWSVDTRARLLELRQPRIGEFAVDAPEGPALPVALLELDALSPSGGAVEFQYRLDGGFWSPFVRGPRFELSRPELAAQGRHRLEIRGRRVDDYRSLDPTPVELTLTVDPEAPRLRAWLARAEAGLYLVAHDVVSGTALLHEVLVDGAPRDVQPSVDGFVALDEVLDETKGIEVRVEDEVGNVASVTLRRSALVAAEDRTAANEDAGEQGCRCVIATRARGRGTDVGTASVAAFMSMFLVFLRRSRR